MHRITLRDEIVDFAGARFHVISAVEIVPYDDLPQEEYGYRTLAEQIADGITTIEVEHLLTGEVDSIATADIIAQVPQAATERYVVRTVRQSEVTPDSPKVLTEAEYHAERQRRGLT